MARLAFAAAVAGAVMLHAQQPTRAPQTFRSGTEVVFVDVSVRERGRPVTGLTADDFTLMDNGVAQRIESVDATAVPIDLTAIIDVSGNPSRPWTKRMQAASVISRLETEMAAITRVLRPQDRVRLLAVDGNIQLVSRLSPGTAPATIERLEFDGLSALYDTLTTALLEPSEPARRHVILARTKGTDSISSVTALSVLEVASRSDALFHIVMMESAHDEDLALHAFQCNADLMGICAPTRRSWVPFQRRLFFGGERHPLTPDGEAIAAAAEATGGALHKTELFSEPSLLGTLEKTLEDFRSGYLLRYRPQGVPPGGWHTIDVKVRGSRGYTVRARKGYGVDTSAPDPPRSLPEAPHTVSDFVALYDAREYPRFVRAVQTAADPARLLRDFEAGGNPWPANPRIEAAFALELAEPALFARQPQVREQAYAMLERFTRLIRDPLEPTAFERYWHFAALTMLESSLRSGVSEAFVDRALARFPDEPRFILSRAIVAEQGSMFAASGPPAPARASDVEERYKAAIDLPDISAEARIRFAWSLHRTGRHEAALAQLREAARQPIQDRALRYLRQLFLGHVHAALNQQQAAAEAYRAAQVEVPTAQSARVAAMNLKVLLDDRPGAEALAEEIQVSAPQEFDPWWSYWQGQGRFYPAAIARVRELAR